MKDQVWGKREGRREQNPAGDLQPLCVRASSALQVPLLSCCSLSPGPSCLSSDPLLFFTELAMARVTQGPGRMRIACPHHCPESGCLSFRVSWVVSSAVGSPDPFSHSMVHCSWVPLGSASPSECLVDYPTGDIHKLWLPS